MQKAGTAYKNVETIQCIIVREVYRTVAADDTSGMVVLLLAELGNLIQLLGASIEIVNLDAVLERLGADQGKSTAVAVQRCLLLVIVIKPQRDLSSERCRETAHQGQASGGHLASTVSDHLEVAGVSMKEDEETKEKAKEKEGSAETGDRDDTRLG